MQFKVIRKLSPARLLIPLLALGTLSCIPQRSIIYFQDHAERRHYTNPFAPVEAVTERYILQPNDHLLIRVSSSNPKLTEIFHQGESGQGNIGLNHSPLSQFPIDDNHEIDFPFVGKINLKGATRSQATEIIRQAIEPFVANVQVTVRLANPSFIILGEINSPGRVAMGKEQVHIFEAIALAGDISTFGKRRAVKVLRPTPSGTISFNVDLTDRNIVDSEKYFIYPNDIIYVRPMRAKVFGIGET